MKTRLLAGVTAGLSVAFLGVTAAQAAPAGGVSPDFTTGPFCNNLDTTCMFSNLDQAEVTTGTGRQIATPADGTFEGYTAHNMVLSGTSYKLTFCGLADGCWPTGIEIPYGQMYWTNVSYSGGSQLFVIFTNAHIWSVQAVNQGVGECLFTFPENDAVITADDCNNTVNENWSP